MRLRHNPKADIAVENSEYVEQAPKSRKGHWNELFGNDNPIHIEIGMGKGQFLMTLASQNPGINYVGIERVPTVLYKALKKQEELKLPNLKLMAFNADEINTVFEKDEVERIYLNFSDPWPKDRHALRRLTSPRFLKLYDEFLSKDGFIEFKTDNRSLFDYSLEAAVETGWKTRDVTYDLHNSEYAEGNIMTEYEVRFSSMGVAINKVIIYR
ncbi:MAG: tRNA (guanosine(46)-N7)-methyltransferase TrmB [Lachnospiraceae bacterium]|nr:tRNA (guanosine(46)-N7)-methyltransferase TrmB [Lachnospiraceae bacterium]